MRKTLLSQSTIDVEVYLHIQLDHHYNSRFQRLNHFQGLMRNVHAFTRCNTTFGKGLLKSSTVTRASLPKMQTKYFEKIPSLKTSRAFLLQRLFHSLSVINCSICEILVFSSSGFDTCAGVIFCNNCVVRGGLNPHSRELLQTV